MYLILFVAWVVEISAYCQQGAAGPTHTCIVDQALKLKCWGNNDFGELVKFDVFFVRFRTIHYHASFVF